MTVKNAESRLKTAVYFYVKDYDKSVRFLFINTKNPLCGY